MTAVVEQLAKQRHSAALAWRGPRISAALPAADAKDVEDRKAGTGYSEALAADDLDAGSKSTASSAEYLATTRVACRNATVDHETTTTARKEELDVIVQVKKNPR